MLNKYESAGNLTAARSNSVASSVDVRQGRTGRKPLNISLPSPQSLARGAEGSVFEAMMAVNKAQNQVFEKVLDGPVSQQTQRQLAQLQALNMKNALAEEIKDSQELPPAQEQAKALAQEAALTQTLPTPDLTRPLGGRRSLPLNGGSTIVRGLDTGKIFSPAQLSAFRQRTSLNESQGAAAAAAQNILSGTALDGARTSTGGTLESVGQSAIFPQLKSEIAPGGDNSGAGGSQADKSGVVKTADASAEATKPNGLSIGDDLEIIIRKVGAALGLDPSLIKAVIKTESNFNQRAVSPAGAKGLMQLMPGTAKEMGVQDPFNPLDNIWGGARYLKKMLDSHGGNLNKALAAYNWGPGNFRRHGAEGRNMPRETRRYIEVVNRNYNQFKKDTTYNV
ncbi:MAG: lytic transglycosylase domain-containing protein [Deltaproteobacteria bacterium]|jgi:soluble lytic murein transglycosylase-like protein|nr:lytic transglycosylase domain-containing protein [Deltaproteobacteria bacterium]